MDQHFYANGKILLSSEFMILHGAKALALPISLGQSLELLNKNDSDILNWKAAYNSEYWFECKIDLNGFKIISTSNTEKANHLIFMLQKLIELQPNFYEKLHEADVITKLDFDPLFGFGSSSTLTSLLAQWANADPLNFHFGISRGSGYDVACATSKSAILYEVIDEMPVIQAVDFTPEYSDKIWLVYLGVKQDSSKSVAAFLNNYVIQQDDIDFFSALTCDLLKVSKLDDFGDIIMNHEERLSGLLQLPVIKDLYFKDLDGYAKSLGAWGGDFALVATEWEETILASYLTQRGFQYWYSLKELMIS